VAVASALAKAAGLFSAMPASSTPAGHEIPPSKGTRPPSASTPSGDGGTSAGNGPSSGAAALLAAIQRLDTLPAATRHAWLAAHLAALRAGRITLSEIP
jgi:hypothetical protein